MRLVTVIADVFMGLVVGAVLYGLIAAFLPGVAGPLSFVALLLGSVLFVSMTRPGGALANSGANASGGSGAWSLDRVLYSDVTAWRVPVLLLKIVLAWALSGILLAVLYPSLHARGINLSEPLVWAVILGALALAIGPDLWRLFRRQTNVGRRR